MLIACWLIADCLPRSSISLSSRYGPSPWVWLPIHVLKDSSHTIAASRVLYVYLAAAEAAAGALMTVAVAAVAAAVVAVAAVAVAAVEAVAVAVAVVVAF